MPTQPFVVLDQGQAATVNAAVTPKGVRLSSEALYAALGWEFVPEEGLCRDGMCIPVALNTTLVTPEGVDLASLATVLGRPLALDLETGTAYLGASAQERRLALTSLQAPDFTLPDLNGRLHSLSEHRGNKVFLVAYASW